MKNILLYALIFTTFNSFSQNVLDEINNSKKYQSLKDSIEKIDVQEKVFTVVINANSYNKSKLYSELNKWVSLNYYSANDVIQMNDKEGGTMIVKGLNTISFKNPRRLTYPKAKIFPTISVLLLRHTLEVNVKENKFRLIFTINNIEESEIKTVLNINPYYFENISFKGASEKSLLLYNNYWEAKGKGMGKKNREKFLGLSEPTFIEVNTNLNLFFINKIFSIINSLKESKKDQLLYVFCFYP